MNIGIFFVYTITFMFVSGAVGAEEASNTGLNYNEYERRGNFSFYTTLETYVPYNTSQTAYFKWDHLDSNKKIKYFNTKKIKANYEEYSHFTYVERDSPIMKEYLPYLDRKDVFVRVEGDWINIYGKDERPLAPEAISEESIDKEIALANREEPLNGKLRNRYSLTSEIVPAAYKMNSSTDSRFYYHNRKKLDKKEAECFRKAIDLLNTESQSFISEAKKSFKHIIINPHIIDLDRPAEATKTHGFYFISQDKAGNILGTKGKSAYSEAKVSMKILRPATIKAAASNVKFYSEEYEAATPDSTDPYRYDSSDKSLLITIETIIDENGLCITPKVEKIREAIQWKPLVAQVGKNLETFQSIRRLCDGDDCSIKDERGETGSSKH